MSVTTDPKMFALDALDANNKTHLAELEQMANSTISFPYKVDLDSALFHENILRLSNFVDARKLISIRCQVSQEGALFAFFVSQQDPIILAAVSLEGEGLLEELFEYVKAFGATSSVVGYYWHYKPS